METLKTILYFSIFDYPLKLEEICNFSISKNRQRVQNDLEQLMEKKVIIKVDEYYLIDSNTTNIDRRKKGNQMATAALVTAQQKAGFIAKFPFVEAVGISGSLSKGYYDNNSDIDFFVITKPNKLWICRTLLMLYKKIFLLNSRKYFCINYFMSSGNLEIEEKNRFTATEIKTLIPIEGKHAFEEFYKKNMWISGVFGAFSPELETIGNIRKPKTVQVMERVLDSVPVDFLDTFFKRITVYFWKIKFKQMPIDDFEVALKSTKNISKHHPQNFQKKVISKLNEKYDDVRTKYNIELPKEYV